MATTVVGSFETVELADAAVEQLTVEGFERDAITVHHDETDDGEDTETVRVTVVADDDRAADILTRTGAFDVHERHATWAEATAPIGGNTVAPALSTLPDTSLTADVPIAPRA